MRNFIIPVLFLTSLTSHAFTILNQSNLAIEATVYAQDWDNFVTPHSYTIRPNNNLHETEGLKPGHKIYVILSATDFGFFTNQTYRLEGNFQNNVKIVFKKNDKDELKWYY